MKADCPRAKSQWTPCYLRDGEIVVVETYYGRTKICVGCEVAIERIKQQAAQETQP